MPSFALGENEQRKFDVCVQELAAVEDALRGCAPRKDLAEVTRLREHFIQKVQDFFDENRKLNIGVVGQVKAGKSSFLNTLLFGGREILPKASTPKTATLTKMEYAEENVIEVEYYTPEEWAVLEENAAVDLDEEIYISARELVTMARDLGLDPRAQLAKGRELLRFDTYEDLIACLNDYVGEDGRYTPLVKAVTLRLHKDDFRGLSIVDTPGLNDPIASRTIRTKEFIEVCDVVFFLSQSSSFLDKSDWDLLSAQLPQKGVKKLVLLASKYDSGVRDVLKVPDEDDIWGGGDDTADNIPDACALVARKLERRAKDKVREYTKGYLGQSPRLAEVIRGCEDIVLVSSMAENMVDKPVEVYSPEERNVYEGLLPFAGDIRADLKRLGNFGPVREIFAGVVAEKEQILRERSASFVPDVKAELRGLLTSCQKKVESEISLLSRNDRAQLLTQKQAMQRQMAKIEADVRTEFNTWEGRLKDERMRGVQELRSSSQNYAKLKDQEGSETREGSYTTGHLFWKKRHYYTYQVPYTYLTAADAVDNLRDFVLESESRIEQIFTASIDTGEMRRRLLDVVVNNFDMSDETYNADLFRIKVEETINQIDFPVFKLSCDDILASVSTGFSGEITSADKKMLLRTALANGISSALEKLCAGLDKQAGQFIAQLNGMAERFQAALLENISAEFDGLLKKLENKEQEISRLERYATALRTEVQKL